MSSTALLLANLPRPCCRLGFPKSVGSYQPGLLRMGLKPIRQRALTTSRNSNNIGNSSSSNGASPPPPPPLDEKQPGWLLRRMAPPKGGTEPPDPLFLAVPAVVCGAGYYAWFVQPPTAQPSQPTSQQLEDQHQQKLNDKASKTLVQKDA